MKRRLVVVISLTAIVAALFGILNQQIEYTNKRDNGFERKFIGTQTLNTKSIKLPQRLSNICGSYQDVIFYQSDSPQYIYALKQKSDTLHKIILSLPLVKHLAPVFFVNVQYPNYSLVGGNCRKIIRGNINSTIATVDSIQTGAFNCAQFIWGNRMIIRTIDRKSLNMFFASVDLYGTHVDTEKNISEPLHDAGFTHDGLLSYDPMTNKLIYVDFYSNRLICFDTGLRLVYKSTTVDTNVTSNVSAAKFGPKITFGRPPIMVNSFAAVDNNIVYVISNVKANNEKFKTFQQNSVVDMYTENNGSYIGSFYIEDLKNKEIRSFKIIKNTIYVTTTDDLKLYQLINIKT